MSHELDAAAAIRALNQVSEGLKSLDDPTELKRWADAHEKALEAVICRRCERREDADRRMWQAIRRGLLAIVKGIEVRYGDDRRQRNAT